MPTPAPVAPDLAGLVLEQAARGTALPLWVRVALWAWGNADHHGHARTTSGQLRRAFYVTAPDVSRAVHVARARGLLDPCSTSACLVLPGWSVAPCPATHRYGL